MSLLCTSIVDWPGSGTTFSQTPTKPSNEMASAVLNTLELFKVDPASASPERIQQLQYRCFEVRGQGLRALVPAAFLPSDLHKPI